jgi:hypothetical protein
MSNTINLEVFLFVNKKLKWFGGEGLGVLP